MYFTPSKPTGASSTSPAKLMSWPALEQETPVKQDQHDPFGFHLNTPHDQENVEPFVHQDTTPLIAHRPVSSSLKTPRVHTPHRNDTGKVKSAFFAGDPEMDSTPFIYRGRLRSTPIPEKRSVHTLNERPLPPVPTEKELQTSMAEMQLDVEASGGPVDDIFGLGAFDDVFITEQDLERAKDKLEQEGESSHSATPLEMTEQHVQTVLRWSLNFPDRPLSSNGTPFSSVRLCYNFVVIGLGEAQITPRGLHWCGRLYGRPLLQNDVLNWPLSELEQVRTKFLNDEPPLLLFTLDKAHFLQMLFGKFGFVLL